ncbi:MAG: hypothetical protein AAFQ79_04870 [Pseudomonadota bacterium]
MPKKPTTPPAKGQGGALSEILAAKAARKGKGPRVNAFGKGPHQGPQQRGGKPKLFPGRTGGR